MRRLARAIVGVSLACSALFVASSSPAGATGPSCSNRICSGSDTNTGTNFQGSNTPQIYLGDLGTFDHDSGAYGRCGNTPSGGCINHTSANNSAAGSLNTTIGLGWYYTADGASSALRNSPAYVDLSNYCWGWLQGSWSIHDLRTLASAWSNSWYSTPTIPIIFLDIAESNSGWTTSNGKFKATYQGNRDVFNGFTDYVAGRSSNPPSGPSCSDWSGSTNKGPKVFGYGLYYNNAFLSSFTNCLTVGCYAYMPNTVFWPAIWENSYWHTHYPGSCSAAGTFQPTCGPGRGAGWYGTSNYRWGWQYLQYPDWDEFTIPFTLPTTPPGLKNKNGGTVYG